MCWPLRCFCPNESHSFTRPTSRSAPDTTHLPRPFFRSSNVPQTVIRLFALRIRQSVSFASPRFFLSTLPSRNNPTSFPWMSLECLSVFWEGAVKCSLAHTLFLGAFAIYVFASIPCQLLNVLPGFASETSSGLIPYLSFLRASVIASYLRSL